MKNIILLFIIFCCARSQIAPSNGLRENPPGVWALTSGTVYIMPGSIIEDATIVIRDGLIENVGEDITIPPDATIIDMFGNTIYPGFIDSWLEISTQLDDTPHHDAHWNYKVNARRELSHLYKPDEKQLKEMHKQGFTVAHIVPDSGIFQGQSALIQLDHKGTILKSSVAQNIAYEVEGWGSDKYPNSLLGVVALMRQTFIDANWYREVSEKLTLNNKINESLKKDWDLDILGKWIANNKPFIIETNHELTALRSFNIAKEFKLNLWLLGSGYEYRRISELKTQKPFIILPMDFPTTPDISDPYQELQFSTAEFKHWDMAPDNPALLIENNIPIALTTHGLKGKEFRKNLKRSVERSLSASDALAALTTTPAKMMKMKNQLGKIQKGFLANLTISDGDYFKDESRIISTWIGGNEYPVTPKYDMDIKGKWNLSIGNNLYHLEINKKKDKYSGKIIQDTTEYKLSKLKIKGRFISWQVKWDSMSTTSRFTGHLLTNKLEGNAHDQHISWSAVRIGSVEEKVEKIEKEERSNLSVFYPEGTYGWDVYPKREKYLVVKNATLWTCSNMGIKEADILFSDGKVKKIGKSLTIPKGARVIDGTGKHVTPGLIDCHSHSAAFSINEGTQSITAEVRIQDVLNSDDITIYRELAGGLTMANILHGSANTIGGQNAVIKLRWGATPEELLYENSIKGIKFALGENVKQSNWGDDNVTRYPQTRMGVEQILRDAFISAREYQEEWKEYNNNPKKWKKKITPRRDLELEALLEILEGKRQIHCHSYRQDEILMLTRVAEDFGFTMGTFQHVLEGYKVADRLVEHGAHASTFSDWWAYKYEVIDAIPYNAAIMTEVGVTVSFNSDSRELARRMNTEAAKGVKYGSMSEEEALKLVTLNPAIQLGIDKWVGSLEIGKDADFVIWNDHPLSTSAICEQTWIDGIQYFSLEEDIKLKIRDEELRDLLVNKILSNKNVDPDNKWKHHEQQSTNHRHCLEKL